MRPELEALKKDTDALPDGPDKAEALAAFEELRRADEEIQEYWRREEEEKARTARWNLVFKAIALPAGIVLAYLAVSSILTTGPSDPVDSVLAVLAFGVPALALLAYVVGLLPNIPSYALTAGTASSGYTPPPKSKLIVIAACLVVMAIALSFITFDMIDAGRVFDRNQVYTRAAHPGKFWWKVCLFGFAALFAAIGTVACVASLIRYPRHPFRQVGPTTEIDPLREADVYVSYGRHAQAVEILEQAHAEHPDRHDVAKRLSELRRKRPWR